LHGDWSAGHMFWEISGFKGSLTDHEGEWKIDTIRMRT